MNRLTDKTYNDFYNELLGQIKLSIASEKDEYVITQHTEDLVKFYFSKHALKPIEFDQEKEESIEHKKYLKTIEAREREWGYQHEGNLTLECEKVVVRLPLVANASIDTIFRLRTQSISISGGPDFSYTSSFITIEAEIKGYGINRDDEQIADYLNKTRARVEEAISSKNREIEQENEKLKINLAHFINERKEKLDHDKKRLQNLVKLVKIPLARKDDTLVRKIQIEEKAFVQKIKPKPNVEDYVLDRAKVLDIIKLMHNQCLQFEKTPRTYDKLGEENLRDLLLANLNSIFEGKATGETLVIKAKQISI